MLPTANGSIRLFRAFGINVYLHWTWFLVAAYQLQQKSAFDGFAWHVLLYLSIFGIVLLHEFGHALACRSVGGDARRIVLWPLGGVAFVQPPQRPWPVLWSIAAGPLVNVVLLPITIAAYAWASLPAAGLSADAVRYFEIIVVINLVLLVFNLMPIYPLDGGQIFMSVLWLFIDRSKALRITAAVGLAAAVLAAPFAILYGGTMTVILVAFIGWQAFSGFRIARVLARQEQFERDEEARWAEQYARWTPTDRQA